MDMHFKQYFIDLWGDYFPTADLPIMFYYTDEVERVESTAPAKEVQCIIDALALVQKGEALSLDVDTVGCNGGKRYLGFTQSLRPNFEYFLSCGIPGEMEGERYKKSPELVQEHLKHQPSFQAPGKYIVFKNGEKYNQGLHSL